MFGLAMNANTAKIAQRFPTVAGTRVDIYIYFKEKYLPNIPKTEIIPADSDGNCDSGDD